MRNYFDATNALMRSSLQRLAAEVPSPAANFVTAALAELIEIDGCVFLEAGEAFVPTPSLPNRSCWEQWHNRIDLFYGIPARHRGPALIVQGIAIAEILRLRLSEAFADRAFIIHVSWNARALFETKRQYEALRKCRVSFWQRRDGESVFAPIEEFEHEAIGEKYLAPTHTPSIAR